VQELIRGHARLLFAGVATFVLMGVGQALYGPALPLIARHFGLTPAEAGLLISAHWVGCALGVAVMFLAGARVTPRHALAPMVLGAAGLAALAGWTVTLVSAAVFGAGYGMATATFNPRVLAAFGTRGASMLSFLNATFAVGAIVSPLAFVAIGSDPRLGFGLTAILAALVWLGSGSAGGPATLAATGTRPYRLAPGILAFGAVAIGIEACLGGLGPSALIAAGHSEDSAARHLSAFFLVFLAARVALSFTAHRIPSFLLYTGALAAACLCALGAVLVDPGVFFVASGAPASLFFPGFYVTASRKMGDDPRVPPTIIAAGLVGGILSPIVVGPAMAALGPLGFFWILLGVSAATTVAALLSLKRMSR
jgi:fucose permease